MANCIVSYLHFLWAGLAKNVQTGGIVPSQRFLIDKMIAPVPESYRGEIVELGAGIGALTLRLAARCREARILACEINPTLAEVTKSNLAAAGLEKRVEVIADSAENLLSERSKRGKGFADYIISGIPLGNLDGKRALTLIEKISQALSKGGLYVQFQHSLLDRKKIEATFLSLRTVPVLLNFPPAVIYYAQK